MGKKKKNNNYVTPKTEAAKVAKIRDKKKKKTMKIVKVCLAVLASLAVLAGIILAIAALSGAFDYLPAITEFAAVEIEGYGTIYFELYGKDAPLAVGQFKSMAAAGKYNGQAFTKMLDDCIYSNYVESDIAIKGEFSENNVENKVLHKRGTLSMAHLDGDNNSAMGQFFIVTEDNKKLDGKYAAFGRIVDDVCDMELINEICNDIDVNDAGEISSLTPIIIKSITFSQDYHHHH